MTTAMPLRHEHEIRLLIEFTWRTLWGYNTFLLHQNFNDEFRQGLFSRLLGTAIATLETMHPPGSLRSLTAPGANERMAEFLQAFQHEFNGYCQEWRELQVANDGYPMPISLTKYESAAAIRIDCLTKEFVKIYERSATNQNPWL
jgi:hypothetical protein